jgi:hypothetical protein
MNERLCTLMFLIVCASTASAQTYEKNNLPCAIEICLGDGLSELQKVKWERGQSPLLTSEGPTYVGSSPISPQTLQSMKRIFRGRVAEAAPYLVLSAFDQQGLLLLKDVTAACWYEELWGSYTSQSGNPTQVKIALLPDKKNVSAQRWTVVGIERRYPAAVTAAQKQDIEKQLLERYGRFKGGERSAGRPGTFRLLDDGASTFGFELGLPRGRRDDDFKRPPACVGAEKIQVD